MKMKKMMMMMVYLTLFACPENAEKRLYHRLPYPSLTTEFYVPIFLEQYIIVNLKVVYLFFTTVYEATTTAV